MIKIEVLFVVINDVDLLNDILGAFIKIGISGATVLDSQGMANIIVKSDRQHIFHYSYLKTLMQDALPYNKTIFTVIENPDLTAKAVKVVQDIIGDVPKPGVGFMFSMPVGKVYPMGLVEE